MYIQSIQQALPGVYKITPDAGPAFFLRAAYLSAVSEERLLAGAAFDADEEQDLLHAVSVYGAECAAMTYLGRAEHCRAGLEAKLIKKGLDRAAVSQALDYLQSLRYVDDARFAAAWLRNRSIDHLEGRRRLSAELSARQVSRDAAEKALDEFFAFVDEEDLCRRACERLLRFNRDEQKVRSSLMRSGFSLREISRVCQEKHSIFLQRMIE